MLTLLEQMVTVARGFTGQATRRDPANVFELALVSPSALEFRGDRELRTVLKTVGPAWIEHQVQTQLDLTFLGKWVRSATSDISQNGQPLDPSQEDPIGGMPVADRIVVPGTQPLNVDLPPASLMQSDPGQQAEAGVPEVLGRIEGTVTHTLAQLIDGVVEHDVTIDVRWEITEATGTPDRAAAANFQVRAADGVFGPVQARLERLATDPRVGTWIRLPVLLSELRATAPEEVLLLARPSVRLTADGDSTGWVALAPVPLMLPTIPIPTVVVLCENADFQGAKAVLVTSSVLGKAMRLGRPLAEQLELTRTAADALGVAGTVGGVADFVALLAGGGAPGARAAVDVLKNLVASADTRIAVGSHFPTLDIPELLFRPGFLGIGRLTGQSMADSVIVVGLPGTRVTFGQRIGSDTISPLVLVIDDEQVACAIRNLGVAGQHAHLGPGPKPNPHDPTRKIVLGGSVVAYSPKQDRDQIVSVAIAPQVGRLPVAWPLP